MRSKGPEELEYTFLKVINENVPSGDTTHTAEPTTADRTVLVWPEARQLYRTLTNSLVNYGLARLSPEPPASLQAAQLAAPSHTLLCSYYTNDCMGFQPSAAI